MGLPDVSPDTSNATLTRRRAGESEPTYEIGTTLGFGAWGGWLKGFSSTSRRLLRSTETRATLSGEYRPHYFDVLLRHRLLRQPGGFEGARLRAAVHESDALPLVRELREVAPAAVLALLLAGRRRSRRRSAVADLERPEDYEPDMHVAGNHGICTRAIPAGKTAVPSGLRVPRMAIGSERSPVMRSNPPTTPST
jgi:hypothetical protein